MKEFIESMRHHSKTSYSIAKSLLGRIDNYLTQLTESCKLSTSTEFRQSANNIKRAPYETEDIEKLCFSAPTPTPLALYFLESSFMLDLIFNTQKLLLIDLTGKAKPEDWEKGIVNLSEGGARFITPKQLTANAKIDFYIHLPDTKHYAQFTANIEGVKYCRERKGYETRLNFYFPPKEMQNKVKTEIQLQEFK